MRFEREGIPFFQSSRADGLCGFALGSLAHGRDMRGATLHCGQLTKGLARLAVAAGVQHIEADEATPEARAYLAGSATSLTSSSVCDEPDRSDQIESALLGRSAERHGSTLLSVVASRTLQMLEHHVVPADELLLTDFGYRLGSGGGGT